MQNAIGGDCMMIAFRALKSTAALEEALALYYLIIAPPSRYDIIYKSMASR
jgi:hypothetical protein